MASNDDADFLRELADATWDDEPMLSDRDSVRLRTIADRLETHELRDEDSRDD